MEDIPAEIEWLGLPVLGVFNNGEKVWWRSYRKNIWKGRYEEFENHKNEFGDYPIEVAKRA